MVTLRACLGLVVTVLCTYARAKLPLPTAGQLAYHALETTQFMHFGVCTFADCEQDDPPQPAAEFNPTGKVDTDGWVDVALSYGAEQVCITAHHSGGFALWQTNTTDYGMRQSPYMDGKGDIVKDFVASARAKGVLPCFYIIPGWDSYESKSGKADPTAYLKTQLAMITELLTKYGPISRLWFDFYGMGCHEYGADCPTGAFPNGWRNITELVKTISPTTVLTMPGTDGCLLADASNNPELGFGAYPSWYYNQGYGLDGRGWNPVNPILCKPEEPTDALAASGLLRWGLHEADMTIQNPGDAWFWHPHHPFLQPKDLWVHWLQTVGRGSNMILNVPPNTTGKIPEEYAASAAAFGRAIAASFKDESAVVGDAAKTMDKNPTQLPSVQCKADGSGGYIMLEIPAGATADAIVAAEDLAQGQSIGSYAIEVKKNGTDVGGDADANANAAAAWVALTGLHGQTVGHKLVDTLPYSAIVGPAWLRWSCLASSPPGAAANLKSLRAHKLSPPEGWPPAPPVEETWALQTLYSTAAKDMTPCATRSAIPTIPPAVAHNNTNNNSAAAAEEEPRNENVAARSAAQFQQPHGHLGENRSSCAAYFGKAGYNYSYVRDEHCCFLDPALPGIAGNASKVANLYLLYNAAANDHMLASNKSYKHEQYAYETDSIECFAYANNLLDDGGGGGGGGGGGSGGGTAGAGRIQGDHELEGLVPLDLYWSEDRKDMWTLASDASRAEAVASGYVFVETTAFVPTKC